MKKFFNIFFMIICLFFIEIFDVEAKQQCDYSFQDLFDTYHITLVLEDGSDEIVAYNSNGTSSSVTGNALGSYTVEKFRNSCPSQVLGYISNGWVGDKTSVFVTIDGVCPDCERFTTANVIIGNLNNYFNFDKAGDVTYVYNTSILGDCNTTNVPALKFFKIGYDLIKIATPIVMVLFATIDLAKAVTAGDEGQIKKAQSHCIKRIFAGVIVFLVFVIFEFAIQLVPGDWGSCLTNIFG